VVAIGGKKIHCKSLRRPAEPHAEQGSYGAMAGRGQGFASIFRSLLG